LQAGDVLTLGREAVGRAWPGPVRPAVVGDENPPLRARDELLAVVRVDSYLADRVVLRELARGLDVGGAEDVRSQGRPVGSSVRGLEDDLAGPLERAHVARVGV